MNEQEKFWAKDYAKDYIVKNSEFNKHLANEAWHKILVKAEKINSILISLFKTM